MLNNPGEWGTPYLKVPRQNPDKTHSSSARPKQNAASIIPAPFQRITFQSPRWLLSGHPSSLVCSLLPSGFSSLLEPEFCFQDCQVPCSWAGDHINAPANAQEVSKRETPSWIPWAKVLLRSSGPHRGQASTSSKCRSWAVSSEQERDFWVYVGFRCGTDQLLSPNDQLTT